jgi:hypothetical protein
MREVAKVVIAVSMTELLLWGLGLWSWVSSNFQRWPWLIERYALIFPLILAMSLLGLRRWRLTRSHIVAAGLTGIVVGIISSSLALFAAQLITTRERDLVWNSLRVRGGLSSFLLMPTLFALFLTVSWFYGALASSLAFGFDEVDRRLHVAPEGRKGSQAKH